MGRSEGAVAPDLGAGMMVVGAKLGSKAWLRGQGAGMGSVTQRMQVKEHRHGLRAWNRSETLVWQRGC